jgi:HSP20 family protein
MANRDITPWRESNAARPFLAPFSLFRRELDRLFDDFLVPGDGQLRGAAGAAIQPDIAVQETQTAYTVTAELPGIDRKDIQIDLKDDTLVIAGEKREEHTENEQGRHYSERAFGCFERRIPLDQEVEADKIEAKFNNGVLTVTLPKNPQANGKNRHIEIKS